MCVCSFSYSAWSAPAPYCHLRPTPFWNILPHFLTKGTIFERKCYWTQNTCFDFLYKFCLKFSLSKIKWARYDQKCILVFVQSTLYIRQILIKLEFYRQIFEKKNTQIQNFTKIRPVRAEVFKADRQTDGRTGRRTGRRTVMSNLIVALRNFANVPKTERSIPFFKLQALILQIPGTAEVTEYSGWCLFTLQ